MTLNEYQAQAAATAIFPPEPTFSASIAPGQRPDRTDMPLYPFLKIGGECGELQEKVGKMLRGDQGIFIQDLLLELGDVLWYVAACATTLGYTLEDVALLNQQKLARRQAAGTLRGSGDHR